MELRRLTAAIVSGDQATTSRLLQASPSLATRVRAGATGASKAYYLDRIRSSTRRHGIAHRCGLLRTQLVRNLIKLHADVHARNRLGQQPLHAAAVGAPGSDSWNPSAQAATIVALIEGEQIQMRVIDKFGVAPLHRAVCERVALQRFVFSWNAAPILQNGTRVARRRCFCDEKHRQK